MPVRVILRLLLFGILCLPAVTRGAHTSASLLVESESARPGDTVWAAVRLEMEPDWHTYWRNPGASGMATEIKWQLPPGVSAGEIHWPVPEKLPEGEFTTYIYKDEVLLLVPLTVASNFTPASITLKASVSWLECSVQCIPGNEDVEAPLSIGSELKQSKDAAEIHRGVVALPAPGGWLSPLASWADLGETNRSIVLSWQPTNNPAALDFYPFASQAFEVLPQTDPLPAENGRVRVRKEIRRSAGEWPSRIGGLIVQKVAGQQQAFEVSVPVASVAPTKTSTTPSTTALTAPRPEGLWKMLVYAFIGGLILNIMPCVLPVIALKILGFVGQSKDNPGRIKALGLVYALGVVVSFLALAGLVIGVKAAGHQAGWGMQFGNPQFLIVLTLVITLVALNLFGLFEITPGARVMGAAGTLASKHGTAGAFFNGVLATVLATPCTAPFLGAALGFAFSQSALVILLIFITVALGLASPYVVLSFNPAWLRLLPKPGAWMERFKVAMGFPMLATAFWIFSLIPVHYGDRSWWLGIFLVIVALAAWVFGEFVQKRRPRPWLAWVVIVALLVAGYVFVLEAQLRWRTPDAASTASTAELQNAGGVAWQKWTPEAVASARATGRPVLVDFTAKWCLTCNTIVKPALESAAVREALQQMNATAFLADYTLFPKNITEELNRYGRAGVPLVLVFPKDPAAPAIVLPEALTPSMVVNALKKAAGKNS